MKKFSGSTCKVLQMHDLTQIFATDWPVLGMVHLDPLPGAPGFSSLADCLAHATADARALAEGGCHGLMLENYGDVPFQVTVAPHTVAAMTRIALAVREAAPKLPLGINVLRNDPAAALGIALAVGAALIRVNVHVGSRWTDQGLIEGRAAETLRLRRQLGGEQIAIWADVSVKHSQPVGEQQIGPAAQELVGRGLADAVIVSGSGTGQPVDPRELQTVRSAIDAPIILGSGVSADNLPHLRGQCTGAIVGTAFKHDGRVCVDRVRALLARL